MSTLEELRREFNTGIQSKEGMTCPVCNRHGKLYKRKLNSGMARQLIWLVRTYWNQRGPGSEWVDIQAAPPWVLRSKQIPTTRYWGLVEKAPVDPEDGRSSSGLYRPTPEGIDFVNGDLEVNKYVYVYNDVVHDASEELISIVDALGDDFDYKELMS